jgi:hypothetical protein
MSAGAPVPLKQFLDNRFGQLSAEIDGMVTESRERGRREYAEKLNQIVRRIRQSPDLEELGAVMTDAASGFADGAAWLRIDGPNARGERIRGVVEDASERFAGMTIPLKEAAALRTAVETRDPVIAVFSKSEVSAALVEVTGPADEERVSIFPVVANDRVPALVYVWGPAEASALELLAQVAAGVWSELDRPAPAPLVQIVPAASTGEAADQKQSGKWENLSPEEQQVHLRAQRYARVQAAEMRLFDPDTVTTGRSNRNLYELLRDPIDRARETFRQRFFANCPTMVDYLHLEIVRTLANDDPEALGKDYPGPMV